MATRLLVAGDWTAARALDLAVLDEMRTDFKMPVAPITQPQALDYITNPDKRAIGYLTGGGAGTLRGFLLAAKDSIGWQIIRVVTDKTLTVQQRLTGFRDAARDVANRLVALGFPNVVIYGVVKAGGRLDTHMTPLAGFTRTVVKAKRTSVFGNASDPGEVTGYTVVEQRVRFSATAAVVAANV